jgi:hypothetical protein
MLQLKYRVSHVHPNIYALVDFQANPIAKKIIRIQLNTDGVAIPRSKKPREINSRLAQLLE